jgi:hypothetical protein
VIDGCLNLARHIVENEMLNGEVIRLDSAHDAAQSGTMSACCGQIAVLARTQWCHWPPQMTGVGDACCSL